MSHITYEFNETLYKEYQERHQHLEGELLVIFQIIERDENKLLDRYLGFLDRNGWRYLDHKIDEGSNYQCLVFKNSRKREIVMAHRGTIMNGINMKDDIEILKGIDCEKPLIIDPACKYAKDIKEMRDKDFKNYKLYQTGHSLGGFLAEVCAMSLPQDDVNAYTFDSVGSKNVLGKFGKSLGIDTTKIDPKNIKNYFPEPNLVNTVNLSFGSRYLICDFDCLSKIENRNYDQQFEWSAEKQPMMFVDLSSEENLAKSVLGQLLSSHPLLKIIRNGFNEDGTIRVEKYIENWPTAKATFGLGGEIKYKETTPEETTTTAIDTSQELLDFSTFSYESQGKVKLRDKDGVSIAFALLFLVLFITKTQ